MRIVFLSPILGDAFGQERVMRDSAALLRGAGHEVILVGAQIAGKLPPNDGVVVLPGIASLHSMASPFRVGDLVSRLLKKLHRLSPDLIHLVDQFDWRVQFALCDRFPVILTSHLVATTCPSSTRLIAGSRACPEKSGFMCLKHHAQYKCLSHFRGTLRRFLAIVDYRMRRRSLQRAKKIIAVSRYVHKTLIDDGWPDSQVALVYNPVEIPALSEPSPIAEYSGPLIFASSRLEAYKGIGFLIRSLTHIEHLPWSLWVAGEGRERALIQAEITRLRLSLRVRLLGRIEYERASAITEACTVFVQPNRGPEPFGLSLAEASAAGRPVVAANLPALNEIVVHGKTGVLFEAGDEKGCASAIGTLLSNESLREEMGRAGRNWIKQKFSSEGHLRRTLTIYAEALGLNLESAENSPPVSEVHSSDSQTGQSAPRP